MSPDLRPAPPAPVWAGPLLAAVLLLATLLALRPLPLPDPAPASAPAAGFSAGRALAHLERIARRPHPVGSAEHARVRGHLVATLAALGFETRVQEATATDLFALGAVRTVWAGRMRNVLARKRGSDSTGALLLVSHYDSAPSSPGASDAGSAVAALLEVARALDASGPLRNDLVVLFTDGEETGCLGAHAFAGDPWAAEVAAVLNLDARGTRGPVLMFETGPDNAWLLRHLAATPYPVGNSLTSTVYRYIPNGTDFTVFRERGMAGLNFAFLHGPLPYHSAADTVDRLDRGTLQQLGANTLDLARRLGNADLRARPRGDAVYFNSAGYRLVVYPLSWALPLSLLTLAVVAGLLAFGVRRRRLTAGGVARGALLFLLVLAAVPAVGLLAVWLVLKLDPSFRSLTLGTAWDSALHYTGFALLALATAAGLYAGFRRRVRPEDAAVGALLVEALLGLAAALFVPGGSYLLTWPVLASTLGVGVWLASSAPSATPRPAAVGALLASALPALFLMVPWIALLFVGLTVFLAWAVGLFVALLAGLLVPHLSLMTARRRWLLPAAATVLALGCLAAAVATADFDREHPRPDSVFYVLDAATGEARWASLDDAPDEWTGQFFGARPERGTLTPFTGARQRRYLLAAAPAAPLPAPRATLLGKEKVAAGRRLRLRVRPGGPAGAVRIDFSARPDIGTLTVDGQPVPVGEGEAGGAVDRLLYFGPPADGFEVALTVAGAQPVALNLVEYTLELPPLPFRPRPPDLLPKVATYSETTLVRTGFEF